MSLSLPPSGIHYFDAHLHLNDAGLQAALTQTHWSGEDLPIAAQVVNGTHPGDWEQVVSLRGLGDTRVLRAYGVHPWYVEGLPEDWELRLREVLSRGAVSVGEIGLDNWIEGRDEALQRRVFMRQLEIASELGLPPSIHCVRAWGLLIDNLRAGPKFPLGFLVHGFGGSVEVLRELAELGGYFSFSAYGADPGRKRIRDAARACPADRILVETDSPDMVPPEAVCRFPLKDVSGKRLHHPAEIQTAYEAIAEWRGESIEVFAEQVAKNFETLFGSVK